jgi:hypothetical protein
MSSSSYFQNINVKYVAQIIGMFLDWTMIVKIDKMEAKI